MNSKIGGDIIQSRINADRADSFNLRLPNQTEQCARKILERLQVGLATGNLTATDEIYHLSRSAEIMLTLRDRYNNV
jgi:hypothetical protein